MKKQLTGALFAGLFVAATAPVQAMVFLDGWQLDTTGVPGGTLTTDIGELSLSGGAANISVEVDGSGNPFVGARFSEWGGIYSVAYVPENAPGPNDFGLPSVFAGGVSYSVNFTGLSGYVSSYNAVTGAIDYMFDDIAAGGGITLDVTTGNGTFTVASFETPWGGGDLNDFFGGSGTNGNSTLEMVVASALPGLFKDSSGNPLDVYIPLDELIVSVRTNNEISTPPGAVYACTATGLSGDCVDLLVLSNGSANLAVPEPATIGLLGMGLAASGFAGFRRRRRTS
jgi:hypothetical protein